MGKKKEKKKDRKVIRGHAIDISSVLQSLDHLHLRKENIRRDTDETHGVTMEDLRKDIGEASVVPKEVLQEWSEEKITISRREFMEKSAIAAFGAMKELDAPPSIMMTLPIVLSVITMEVFGEMEEEDDDDGQGEACRHD